MAMKTSNGNLHLEIQNSRKSPVGILRTSFYDSGSVRHTQHGRITGCTLEQLQILQLAFRDKVISVDDPKAFKIVESKEYGASFALFETIKEASLDKVIYSRKEEWVNAVCAMLIGRIIYAGSKLALSHVGDLTNLWEICGITDKVDVDKHCYEPLDHLLSRQTSIQKSLAKKHLKNGKLVLYDITSSYLEGEYQNSELVAYGYNRDGKKGHEQIVIGLICSDDGCPVAVEVFPGNTRDMSTVSDKMYEIKNIYGVTKAIFVGDRGMINSQNLESAYTHGMSVITALTRDRINELIHDKLVQPSLFDESNIVEITDTSNQWRYCLCKNPIQALKNKATREALLVKTIELLNNIKNYKKATTVEQLGKRVGKVFAKYKTEKYFDWKVNADTDKTSKSHKLNWILNKSFIANEEQLDGCYIITSDVSTNDMQAEEIVASYKKLIRVEQAFRNLKTTSLEVRPIYHRKDDRIKAHVFLCMLAYYVQWHFNQKLFQLTEKVHGKNRRYTFANIIETLKQITKNTVLANNAKFYRISEPTAPQQKILNLLGIKI